MLLDQALQVVQFSLENVGEIWKPSISNIYANISFFGSSPIQTSLSLSSNWCFWLFWLRLLCPCSVVLLPLPIFVVFVGVLGLAWCYWQQPSFLNMSPLSEILVSSWVHSLSSKDDPSSTEWCWTIEIHCFEGVPCVTTNKGLHDHCCSQNTSK